jgi:hypothetical protein
VDHPLLFQVNTRCWLHRLSDAAGTPVTLASVPEEALREWIGMGVTDVWLMGVWTTGPKARALALAEPNIRRQCDLILPGWTDADMPGSPYSIAAYQVPETLGGDAGLRRFRQRLNEQGLRLMLDFVPNHLGIDHPWVSSRPNLFVQADGERKDAFAAQTSDGERWLAHGRDPYWPGWTDTVQLDYRRAETWKAMTGVLVEVARRCDGVRCDVAMLLLREVFESVWNDWPLTGHPERAAGEFWEQAIAQIKRERPGFSFLAESYWATEERLQTLGFDFTYDKVWIDELCARRPASVVSHFRSKPPEFVARCAHFLENHDEPRVASRLSLEEHRAAALAMLTLPGMRFLHDGQMEGARLHLPVQLGVRPVEPVDGAIAAMYAQLIPAVNGAGVGHGRGTVLEPRSAWPDNPTAENMLISFWDGAGRLPALAVVNFASHPSQCRVCVPLEGPGDRRWHLRDVLGSEKWERATAELTEPGLFLDVPAHAAQLFVLQSD